ncbi:MAG: DNA alkylation repair protein [Myxococcota bacterium]|nr:DNA alkylation repair protein [Myxococcota bacterium]
MHRGSFSGAFLSIRKSYAVGASRFPGESGGNMRRKVDTLFRNPTPVIDIQNISKKLDSAAKKDLAGRRMKHVQPLRGVRGTPHATVASVIAATWKGSRPDLTRDSEQLHELFSTAHEDGLVAIGLVAALVPDAPEEALDLAERWIDLVDDVETADALGWMVYAPGLAASGEPISEVLCSYVRDARPIVRRLSVMALMARLPVAIEGPCAAAVRERVGNRRALLIDHVDSETLRSVCAAYIQDSDPLVRKSLARVIRAWGQCEPAAVEEFLADVPGGVNRRIREEAQRGIRKGIRLSTSTDDSR